MTDTVAHAGVAAATAVASPEEADERVRRRNRRIDELFDRVEKLTAKAARQRAQLAETERALAEAIAEVEGA